MKEPSRADEALLGSFFSRYFPANSLRRAFACAIISLTAASVTACLGQARREREGASDGKAGT